MKVTQYFFSLINAAIVVSATRISSRQPITLDNSASQDVGAVYFMTNEQDGNYIVAGALASDGKVTFRQAIATGGKGMHGNSTGADGLYSQNSVIVHNNKHLLATVNAGSHTVSLFDIDQNDPMNIRLIATAPSGGEFPNSVAFNKDASQLCALNTGRINGVSCYTVTNNGLQPIPNTIHSLNLVQTTPATGAPFTASQVVFSEDETKLAVAVKGNQTDSPGFFAIWDKGNNGLASTFKRIDVPSGGARPFSLTNIPGKNAALVADPVLGFHILNFATGTVQANAINGQMADCWSVRSEKTGHYYLIDAGANTVREIAIDNNLHGSNVQNYPLTNNSGPIDSAVATLNGKDYIYSLAPGTNSIEVLGLQGAGSANRVGAFDYAGIIQASNLKFTMNNVQGMATYSKH